LTRIRTRLAAAVLAVAVPAAMAGCFGGGSDSPEDILKETFNNPNQVHSGVLDVGLTVSAQGDQGGNLTAKLSGPVQGNPDDPTAFPQFGLTAEASGDIAGQRVDFQAGATATADQAFVQYQNQAYEVPKNVFDSFKQAYTQQAQAAQAAQEGSSTSTTTSAASLFSRLNVDPASWVTNLSDEGDADVGGTNTVHLHGDVDVGQFLSDLATVAQSTPGAGSLDTSQLDLASSFVQSATIDIYSGKDDHILRKLELKFTIAPPGGVGGLTSVDIDLAIGINDVNQDQTISAPSGAKPLSDLLKQLGVNINPGSLSSIPGLSGSIPGLPGGSSGGGTAPGAGSASAQDYQKYLKCVQGAGSSAGKINACAQKFL
jgi:hypothetical protein